MDVKELLTSFAQMTIFAVMLSMGLALGFDGITRLWRRPSLLLRCVIAAFVIVPLAAMAVVNILPLSFEVRAGIAAMAIIPGAPLTYHKSLKGKGNSEIAGSFQATMALFSLVLVPLWFGVISALYPTTVAAPLSTVFKQIMLVQGLPLILGAALKEGLPEFVEDFDDPLRSISDAMLLGVTLLVLAIGLPLMLKAGVLTVLAVILMAAAALLSGHWLGGSDPIIRQTIAIDNATRNAGLAIALIAINFPTLQRGILVTIVTYAVISAIAGSIYARLYKKRLGPSTDEVPTTV